MKLIKKEIHINNLKISYLDNELNTKKTLLFVHGWGADKYNLQCIYLSLINNFRILAIDLPGFGESTIPDNTFGSQEYSSIIYEFLKIINISSLNFIGHSFGGKIGILLTVNHPELIKRLVLIDSNGIKSKKFINWYIKVGIFKILKYFITNILNNQILLNKLKTKFGSEDYKNAGKMRDIMVKTVNEDFTNLLNKISCPVFLYWGEKDNDTPLWMAKKIKSKIKDSALYIVKNGSHFSFLEDNRIISIIEAFCI